jgi:NAD(P)-dependent dehydrogenase (short-subunit alcohol dehydrogenase family)
MMGVALITGAGRRLGRRIAEALAEDGHDLALHYRTARVETEGLAESLGAARGLRCVAIPADLTDVADVESLMSRAHDALGSIDLLINNASLFEDDAVADLDPTSWQRHLDVNLRAPVLLSRDFARLLPSDATGHIVNLLDRKIANLQPDYFSYTVSKAALHTATQLLAMALAPRVRVNAIAPGLILPSGGQSEAEFAAEQRTAPLGLNGDPAMVVDALRYLNRAPAVTGQVLFVDGGEHLGPAVP